MIYRDNGKEGGNYYHGENKQVLCYVVGFGFI